jgi:hypothetical protein
MEEAKLFSFSQFEFYPIAAALVDEDEIGMQPVKLVDLYNPYALDVNGSPPLVQMSFSYPRG